MRHFVAAAALWAVTAFPAFPQEGGALARLNAADSDVSDAWFGGETKLTLSLSQGVPWRVFTLDGPPRLVLDFRELDLGGADLARLDRSDRITEMTFGPIMPGWTRLVALLSDPMRIESAGLSVDPEGGASLLDVRLALTDAEDFAASVGAPAQPGWDRPEARLTADRPEAAGQGLIHVMLDPGHGGIDPGAESQGVSEADLMLTFARELKEVLLRAGGFEVSLTRDADVFISLEARVAAAQAVGADVFISLHADALDEGVARGSTVYILDETASDAASRALAERHDRADILSGVDLTRTDDQVADVLMDIARLDTQPRSRALAGELVAGIKNATGRVHKRPLRQAGFSVLKSADIPSVLIELAFLSTEAELDLLQDDAWRAGMAAGIRDGLQAWLMRDAADKGLRRQ